MTATRRQLGDQGEQLAVAALKQRGYKILERNWAAPVGEVDLIAKHKGVLVFIEVKTRKSGRFGTPAEAVPPAKQARLRRLADYYLKHKRLGETPVRFDVVAVMMESGGPRLEIIQDAFGL